MTTNSVAITQYVDAISDANKRTGYEYLKRLEFFEKFISKHYHLTVDELTINKMFDTDIYDLLSKYVSYLVKKTDDNGPYYFQHDSKAAYCNYQELFGVS
jgi:hypothetical protein